MAKLYCHVGYAKTVETAPGVYREQMTEYPYMGDLKQDLRKLDSLETLNDGVTLQNLAEIMGDKFAHDNYFAMRYIRFNGVCWRVGYVEVRYPRLWIRFGGVYNGEVAREPSNASGGDSGE